MVEPMLGTIFVALAAKALDRAEDGVVQGGVGVVRRGLSALAARFSREGDKEAQQALERLTDAPDSPERMRRLAELLNQRAAQSPELRGELAGLIDEAKRAGMDFGSITQEAAGEQIVQAAGLVDSEVHINQGSTPPPGV
jgi:hypothetical protein